MIYKFKTEESGIGFDFDIDFEQNQKIYCIIGKNGIGKTKLLEYMSKSLFYTHSIFQKNEKLKYSNIFMQKGIYENIKSFELDLPLDIEINNIKLKDKNIDKWKYTTFENIINRHHKFICDKPIVFIGAKNRGYTKNLNPDNIKILGDSKKRFIEVLNRTLSYMNGNGLEQEEVANWFVSRLLINPNFIAQDQNKINEVITVLQLIERLEPSMQLVKKNNTGGYSLSIYYNEGQLFFGGIPFDKLSTGVISIIKIFQEIVASFGSWSKSENLNMIDAIVFIDEIEAHLHISWQTKIINILKDFFPNTIFFITTHNFL